MILTLWIIIILSLFIIFNNTLKNRKQKKTDDKLSFLEVSKNESYKNLNKILKKNKKGYFSYERIDLLLKSKGNPYNLTPSEYIIIKFLVSIIFFGVLSIGNFYFQGMIFSILGFFLVDILNDISDKKQMKIIRFELADVYDLVNIQTSAGVFLGVALTDAYLIVKNKRFKKALTELAAEINITKNIEKSLDNFTLNFSSIEIDGFVMVMKQSLITGKSRQALDDMSDSLKDINMIEVESNTESVKTTRLTIQVLIYIGILIIIIYGMYLEVKTGWMGIF